MHKKVNKISFAQAINNSIKISMKIDKSVICYGLGVTDPLGVFGTTSGLEKKFGNDRKKQFQTEFHHRLPRRQRLL